MTDQHPIFPPPELVQKWANSSPIQHSDESWEYELFIAHQAARWGADQELEACEEWVVNTRAYDMKPGALRAARRPKPPSHKELALIALTALEACASQSSDTTESVFYIRRALEQLPND